MHGCAMALGLAAAVDAQGQESDAQQSQALSYEAVKAETEEAAVRGEAVLLPQVIQRLRDRGAGVIELGEAAGVSGYLVHRGRGDAYAAYVTPGGGLLVGLLIGPGGEDLTARQLAEADAAGLLAGVEVSESRHVTGRPGSGTTDAVEALFDATQRAEGFTVGDRGPVIHVFADPTCPFSMEHVGDLVAHARAGRLRAHVIPVGLLGERAAVRAVEIMGAERPEVAWEGVVRPEFDHALGAVRVARNLDLHAAWRVRGVPFSVWRGPREVRVFYGAGEASSFAGDVVRGG